jgi:hypothetical protein
MKPLRTKKLLLETLREVPIASYACKKVGIAHATYYRWRQKPEFAKLVEEAVALGDERINDIGESQLIKLMKDENAGALKFWLAHRSVRFGAKPKPAPEKPDENVTRIIYFGADDPLLRRIIEDSTARARKSGPGYKANARIELVLYVSPSPTDSKPDDEEKPQGEKKSPYTTYKHTEGHNGQGY